jgi:3D (Asp-Asp-Asp) domain-containing protein/LysM repeat protein
MISKLKTLIAVAVLSGTVGANAHAEELTVKKGDTLWNIAQVHNTSVENVKNWNQLTTNLIHPGQVLKIATQQNYIVKQDDTLWNIAQRFHVTVEQLMEWNQLTSALIHPGLDLVIYEGLTNPNEENSARQVQAEKATSTSQVQSNSAPQAAAPRSVGSETSQSQTVTSTSKAPTKEITVLATAYTAGCKGCSGRTATGINLKDNPNTKVISVDPSIIPLGSKVYVEGYGEAIAGDTGGAIKGNRIDVFMPTEQAALNFGKKTLKVTILN